MSNENLYEWINKLINNHKKLYFFIASTIKNIKISRSVPKISIKQGEFLRSFPGPWKRTDKYWPGSFFKENIVIAQTEHSININLWIAELSGTKGKHC